MKKLPGMRNLTVICANQMDLIRICRYLSYFHGSSLVVFSSKKYISFVRESIFTNVPPLETATTNSCCISTPKIKLFILVKNGNQTERSVTKNYISTDTAKFPSVSAVKLIFPLHPNNIPAGLRTGPA